MIDMQCAGLIFDESLHYVDHLAPLCSLMNWPLMIREEAVFEAVQQFYPQVRCVPFSSLPPVLLMCNTRPHLYAALGLLNGYSGKTIWLPHGLSDKGWQAPFFQALAEEDLLLVYGQIMRERLLKEEIVRPTLSIGNFRYLFYQKHRAFYDHLMNQRFGSSCFILYAPTWEDAEQNGTFWQAFHHLVDAVPSHLTLLIKVHPHTQRYFMPELERCKGICEKRGTVFLVDDFLPIYPLLDRADAYIGDRSSIGYDFLHMRRPLYFLVQEPIDPRHPSAHLMQCGEQIRVDELPALLNRPDLCTLRPEYRASIERMYKDAFEGDFNAICGMQYRI